MTLDDVDAMNAEAMTHEYDDGPYCDYCERNGHTFSTCAARDDEYADESEV